MPCLVLEGAPTCLATGGSELVRVPLVPTWCLTMVTCVVLSGTALINADMLNEDLAPVAFNAHGHFQGSTSQTAQAALN